MKKLIHPCIIVSLSIVYCLLLIQSAIAQPPPNIEWQKSLGGSGEDVGYSNIQTSDGGYIVAGITKSNNGDVSGYHGNGDFWVVKLSSTGTIQWQKCLGGSYLDEGHSILQTLDGGYIVAGFAYSDDGDVTGHHGYGDFWVVKLSSTGNLQWQKCLGGSHYDHAYAIQLTYDGGYIVTGETWSFDGDVTGLHGYFDYWVVKLSETGNLQWQKCLGGSNYDGASSIDQTWDGGYIVAGSASSNDGDVTGNHGLYDFWIVKLNSTGGIEWQKCLGGTNDDWAQSIQQTFDGGYIVLGYTYSNNGNVTGNHGEWDLWVVKLNSSGALQWQKCLGGSDVDLGYSIQQIGDGYIVTGWTSSNDGDVTGNHGFSDYWVVKLNTVGNMQWQKCYGGSLLEDAYSIQQTVDSGYIVTGFGQSDDGDVTGNHGHYDFWVVKLNTLCQLPDIPTVSAVPGTICAGQSSTLAITSGNLNGATQWKWYTGSCGGSPIGTGTSIIVNPTDTTTYFVRGEGGCAGNGVCATKFVTVNPYPDPAIQHTFSSPCYYTDHTFQPVASIIPGATYQWNFGMNAIPVNATGYGPHIVHYTSAGSKTAKLLIHPNAPGANCPDSSIINFVIDNCPGQILGKVLDDLGNPIENVNVKLFVDADVNGIPDSTGPIRNVFTGGTGVFTMATLIPNHYLIIQTQPSNWLSLDDGDLTPDGDVLANIDSLDNLIPASITINKIDSNNVFIEIAISGSITGNVFNDLDLDEMPDPGEGLNNVTVKLFTDNNLDGVADIGIPIATATTTSSGSYTFLNINPGHYVLVETTPADYISLKDFDATADGDAVPNTNMNNDTLPVTLVNSESDNENFFIDGPSCNLMVTNTNDEGYGSFRHATSCAVSGDTIRFHSSLGGAIIEITSDPIEFSDNIVVYSEVSPRVIIQSSMEDLFHIMPASLIELHAIDIISGYGSPGSGAAFENHGGLKFFDVEIHKNPVLNSGAYLIKSYPISTTTMNGQVKLRD